MIPLYGDFVRSEQYGYEGRIYGIGYMTDPRGVAWMDIQSIPFTATQRREPFVSILVNTGGSVQVPLSLIKRIKPIKDFHHRDMAVYF